MTRKEVVMRKHAIIDGMKTKYFIDTEGHFYNEYGEEMHQTNKEGYRVVDLLLTNKRKKYRVHRIVAETFIPNPDNKAHVNHIDGCKSNNNVENLEWATPQENCRHAVRTGLKTSALPPETVHEICRVMESGLYSQQQISTMFNVPKHTIAAIKQRREWTDISDNYDVEECRSNAHDKTSESIVRKICEMLVENKLLMSQIAKVVDVDHNVVTGIYYGRRYRYISKDYDFSHYDKYTHRYDPDYLEKIRSYMRDGYSNLEIARMLNLKKGQTTNNLLFRQRKIVEKETVGS